MGIIVAEREVKEFPKYGKLLFESKIKGKEIRSKVQYLPYVSKLPPRSSENPDQE
jgi:hypothetical protein